jgi:glycerol-3-phosphate acyltransferase PlsY
VIWFVVALIVGASYLLGSIPSGLIISKSQGIDIREHGSKNIGATNVWRTMGKNWGLLAFFCDAFKGWLAVTIGVWLAAQFGFSSPVPEHHVLEKYTPYLPPDYAGIAAALGCIMGHNFPIWLRFKGGKGVATSLGVIIGMMPSVSLVLFSIWGLVFVVSRYVSLASLIGALVLPMLVLAFMFFGPREGWAAVHGWGYFYFAVAAGGMVIKRHTANIKRLLTGTELRFGDPKPAAADGPASEAPPPPSP